MSKNIIFNKYYRNLRTNIFDRLEFNEFMEVYAKFKRLNFQYKLLKICNKLESYDIPVIEIPVLRFFSKLLDFMRWKFYDFLMLVINGRKFDLYGLTIFCGRQGGGKTISMVEYLDKMKEKFPDCKIVTNFNYIRQDMPFVDWRQFTEVRNGLDGVIFAIDEIQNEYNSNTWQDFPEEILSVVTQQRKQRVKIVATSQVFTRVVKQLREQCYEVVECKTILGRWTRQKCFDADDYNAIVDNLTPERKFKTRKKWKYSFIQSNNIRSLFDSYAVVDSIKNKEYIKRNERGLN